MHENGKKGFERRIRELEGELLELRVKYKESSV